MANKQYKSKYYDPVKAHNYYIKHRQLKGRQKKTSLKGLSETGKIAAKTVKENIQAEYKEVCAKIKEKTQQKIEKEKERMKQQIKLLQMSIKEMKYQIEDKDELKSEKERYKQKIADLRAAYKEKFASIRAEGKALKAQAKEAANSQYEKELKNIRKDKRMLK